MSFGKDAEGRALVQQSAFRSRTFNQAARALTRNRFPGAGTGGRGGPPYWVDMYHPPIGYDSTIRLLPGEFEQDELVEDGSGTATVIKVKSSFIKIVEHFDGHMQKGSICSAGPLANYRDKREACLGCDIYWATAARNSAGRFESSRMSRQNKYVFSIFDYGNYHHVDQIDRQTGKVRTNNQGQAFKDWKPCTMRGCDYCKAGVEIKTGHSTHWPINYTQFQLFRAVERDIGHSCTVCGQINCVDSCAWLCPNCQECVIDMSSTELKPQELIEKIDDQQTCPFCQAQVWLDEVYECRECTKRGQGSGLRASLFDVDLTLTMMLLDNNKKQLVIKSYSGPHAIAPEFAEAAKPLDLVRRYRPDSIDKQSELFGVAVGAPHGQPAGTAAAGAAAQVPYQNPLKPTS